MSIAARASALLVYSLIAFAAHAQAPGSNGPRVAIATPAGGSAVAPPKLHVEVAYGIGSAGDQSAQGRGPLTRVLVWINGSPAASRDLPQGGRDGTQAFDLDVSGFPDGTLELQAGVIVGVSHVVRSAPVSVSLIVDRVPPVITITSPADGQVVTSTDITVTGTVTDNRGVIASVSVNGSPATLN